MAVDVITGGQELGIETCLRRTTHGLMVTAKASPKVEEFFSAQSAGDIQPIATSGGREWVTSYTDPITGNVVEVSPYKLNFYRTQKDIGHVRTMSGAIVDFLGIGKRLIEFVKEGNTFLDKSNPVPRIHLGFLRLVGISKGDGVKFLIPMVISYDEFKQIRERIHEGQNTFYQQYIKTVEFRISTVSNQTV